MASAALLCPPPNFAESTRTRAGPAAPFPLRPASPCATVGVMLVRLSVPRVQASGFRSRVRGLGNPLYYRSRRQAVRYSRSAPLSPPSPGLPTYTNAVQVLSSRGAASELKTLPGRVRIRLLNSRGDAVFDKVSKELSKSTG